MRIHREGYRIIVNSALLISMVNVVIFKFLNYKVIPYIFFSISLIVLILIIYFFRNPKRNTTEEINNILAPVDGKVVIIEEVHEPEYFNDKRLKVSIFMSPLNVHVTRYPLGGDIIYSKYHPGKYLVAWHPKSSILNERTTIVVKNDVWSEVLFRQIAGYVARRIVLYPKVGDRAIQGQDFGFIKFGSRLDVFLPLNTKLNVSLNQNVIGGETIISKKD